MDIFSDLEPILTINSNLPEHLTLDLALDVGVCAARIS